GELGCSLRWKRESTVAGFLPDFLSSTLIRVTAARGSSTDKLLDAVGKRKGGWLADAGLDFSSDREAAAVGQETVEIGTAIEDSLRQVTPKCRRPGQARAGSREMDVRESGVAPDHRREIFGHADEPRPAGRKLWREIGKVFLQMRRQ